MVWFCVRFFIDVDWMPSFNLLWQVHVPGEVHITSYRLCTNRLIFKFPSFQPKTRRMQRKKQPKQHLQDPWIFSTIEDTKCWLLLMLYSSRKCAVQMFLQVVKRDTFSKYVDYVWEDNATIESLFSRLCPNDAVVLFDSFGTY